MTTTASFLEMLAERERAARVQAEYLRAQIEQLAGQLNELEASPKRRPQPRRR